MSHSAYNPGRLGDFILTELWQAYGNARRGKRRTVDEHRFELHDIENLHRLRDSIMRRTYRPSRGVAFIVHDPVIREIVAAPFRDRVVHHFLFNICGDWWDRHFIYDSYSCRKNKGTLFGQKRLLAQIRQASQNYTIPTYVLKLDILGYFIHLPHDKLYQRALWGLRRQFFPTSPSPEYYIFNNIRCHPGDRQQLFQILSFLWYQIINDDPMRHITIRGHRSDWRDLPPTKSLFNQPKTRGIVIGNLTSQLLSNIYLDQLDRFITLDLGYKYYGRYVDDFYIVIPQSQSAQLLRDIDVIDRFLRTTLHLTLHPQKRFFQPIERGIPFIGAVIYPNFIISGKRSRSRLYKAAYDLTAKNLGQPTDIVGRMGTIKHLNNEHFFQKLFDTFGWDY